MGMSNAERQAKHRARQKIAVTETIFASTRVEAVTTNATLSKCRHPADVPWQEREAMSNHDWRRLVDKWNLSEGRVMVDGRYVSMQ